MPIGTRQVATIANYVTEGLDAVVINAVPSKLYSGSVHLTIAGNPRDLAIATERAAKIGGVVD